MSVEMVSSLLNPDMRGNVKIPVEHLDYNYIQNCTDLKYLEKIIAVLRSGEEGIYPHLTEFCEKHIEKLNPRSRALRKQRSPASAADFSSEEWSEIMEDLKIWETTVKKSEVELGKSSMYFEGSVPPVRGTNSAISPKQNAVSSAARKENSVLPRDYREWDKYDVEKECSKIDDNVTQNFSTMVNQCLPKINRHVDIAGLTEKERIVLANREKDKGNEAFRANDYEEAVVYYTRSVSVMPTAAAYNNRAQAELKLQQWHSALNDCHKVLEMEPDNLKALLRHATAQKHLGNLEAAADDLSKVLESEPQNVIAKKMLQEVVEKLSECTAWTFGKGRRILIEEVEDKVETGELTEDVEDKEEAVPTAKPSLCVGGESAAAPAAERPDMGNAQKKSPSRAEGAPQGEAGTHGPQRKGKRGSVDLNRAQEHHQKELANGARAARSCAAEQASGGDGDSRTGGATADCGNSSRLDAPSGALPPPLARLKNEGNQLFKNGQFADALEKYSQAISGFKDAGIDSPEDLSILYSNRAACYLKDGNSTDCIQDCTRALELQPFSLKPLLRRAMAYESLERYRMAYVDYKTVLQIDVGVQAAHDSIHRITKVLIEQDGPSWREKLPEIPLVPLSAQQHRREEPPSAELVEARAARAAEEAARKAEARFSSLKQEGNDYVKKGQFAEALEKYSECLTLKPDECAIYTNRALCHLKLEHFAEAKEDCDSALQLEPSNKKAFYRRAMAYKGLKDYLACSSDLQEVLHLDPNVQEAERELEEVTMLLRESLVAGSPDKQRRNMPIREVDGSDEDTMNKNSNNNHGNPQPVINHNNSFLLHPTNAYEFGHALHSALSQDDVVAAAEMLQNVEPETLPLYMSNKLDGDSMLFLMQALEHLLQRDPILVYQHLNHLHTADRFSVVVMLLGQHERRQITSLFEHLSAVESKGFTAKDVQNLAKKYI